MLSKVDRLEETVSELAERNKVLEELAERNKVLEELIREISLKLGTGADT